LRNLLLAPESLLPILRGGSSSYGLGMQQAGAVIHAWNHWVRGKPIAAKKLIWQQKFELPEVL
jgi:hypothetical protein